LISINAQMHFEVQQYFLIARFQNQVQRGAAMLSAAALLLALISALSASHRLLLSAALILAVSPTFAEVPCGREGNEHRCLVAKVGSWTLKEKVLITMGGGGEGSVFTATSGDSLQNQALTLACYAIRSPGIPDITNGQLKFQIGVGEHDYDQGLIEDRAKVNANL
jgi:hypothetical protein